MKRMPFEPPTEHYDERVKPIDEQICALIRQRKDVSNNNPGFPKKQLIAKWSVKYELYEDFINGIFGHFQSEELYKPIVEPKGFVKNLPILQSFEKDDLFFSVTFIRQYANASVLHLSLDRDNTDEIPGDLRHREFTFFDLTIEGEEAEYDCRNVGGGGSGGHTSFSFIITPPLPDDFTPLSFVFKEYKNHICTKATGLEFVIKITDPVF